MKREYQYNPYDVSKHFPILFWRKCLFCEKEFIRESGYKFHYPSQLLNLSKQGYACNLCCCSVSHCHDTIKHWFNTERAKRMGTIPPAPPMRTYRSK